MDEGSLYFFLHEELESSSNPMLIVVRGLPGSGKSTLARKLLDYFKNAPLEGDFPITADHFEADMFFVGADGIYRWDPKRVAAAHRWCQDSVELALSKKHMVIVSNTSSTKREVDAYIEIAGRTSAKTVILAKKLDVNYGNVHGVPADVLDKMKARWAQIPGEIVL